MKKKLRIAVLVHETLVPPDSIEGMSDVDVAPFKTEFDVVSTLREMGHEAWPVGVGNDLGVIQRTVQELRPAVAFNLLEEFDGVGVFDAHVVAYLEMIKLKYTGCNPRGLMLAHDKALSKLISRYHRIPVPNFHVFALGKRIRRPAKLGFPLIVKSLTEEGSVGISQASVVYNDRELEDRVEFVHRTINTDAIAEEFIEGRELYVGVMGNERVDTLPVWELSFKKLRDDAPRIATSRIKWDPKYQEKIGIETHVAEDLPEGLDAGIPRLCKRIYRGLSLSGYARLDLRLSERDGRVYLIEANPNPQLAYGEDFAESAHHVGMEYEALLEKILRLGMRYTLRGQA